MKHFVTSIALVVGLAAGAAIAGESSALNSLDFNNLSSEQLESLSNILSGLPRQ